MITCVVRYEIDAACMEAFETYAAIWLEVVPRLGGLHHGYLLPLEGSSDVAIATFSFESLARYEQYRTALKDDAQALKADLLARESKCIRRYDRSFFRPLNVQVARVSDINY